jgi:hypothetical protein
MTMRIPVAVLLLAFPSLAAAADWQLDCPAQLATAQGLSGPAPAGWSAVARTTSAVQDAAPGATITGTTPPMSISVFDGPPSEMADLVPDNPNARVQRWTFGKARTRDVYVVCNYADTRIKLAQKVPGAAASCALRGAAGTGVVCR